ncbi:MAG: hypothetical protein IJ494_02245 [Bacteroides sp.]|nr:hypothetical protein [Bacteroides sp.]
MKRFIYTMILGGMLLTACTEDDSSLAHIDISDIEIAEFNEDGYTVVSYAGNKLELVADVVSGYTDSQLVYTWYLIDLAREDRDRYDYSKVYDQEKIGEGKTLSYEVNLPPGEYSIVCEVKADNGYTVTRTTTLYTITNFTTGHYILKETADGNTDVDVYNEVEEKLIENVLTAVLGAPMSGKPLTMSMCFSHSYVDANSNEMSSTNIVSVATEDNDFKTFSTTDLSVIFDKTNLLYGEMEADERPYSIVSGMWTNYYFSSKGVRTQYSASMSAGSGKYGVAAGEGASPFITYHNSGMGVLLWDKTSHSIAYCDYNGGFSLVNDASMPTNGLTDYECIACGTNQFSGISPFLLQNKETGERKLYLMGASFMGPEIYEIRPLPVDSHLAQSTKFSTCVTSAAYIYLIHDNVIYAYNLETGEEETLTPKGLPADAQITYISNQYLNPNNFLVVGTQKNNEYTLYYYDIVGGKPDGDPQRVITGEGKVKSMRYTKAGLNTFVTVPPYMD